MSSKRFDIECLLMVYNKLRNSKLCKEKDTSTENIEEFQKILNSCLPKTEEEWGFYDAIRTNYLKSIQNSNNMTYINFIRDNNLYHLCLYTEGKHIVRFLNVANQIYIKWDDGNYKVELNNYIKTNKYTSNVVEVSGEHHKFTKPKQFRKEDYDNVKFKPQYSRKIENVEKEQSLEDYIHNLNTVQNNESQNTKSQNNELQDDVKDFFVDSEGSSWADRCG